MSADNWATCPRCHKKMEAEREKAVTAAQTAAESAYGKLPKEEYQALQQAADKAAARVYQDENTMREDYEMGLSEDGEFYIRYSAYCEECGFKFRYEHDEKVAI